MRPVSFSTFQEHKNAIINRAWLNANVGDILPEPDIYQYVEHLHRDYEDFIDGNIAERIEEYENYELLEVDLTKVDIDGWLIYDSLLDKYSDQYKISNNYPPIVLGTFGNKYTIIDGAHRANALADLGVKTILAWVGID